MKKKIIYVASAVLFSTSLFLTSCGGNNGDMPPETTTGDNNRETGVDGTGDLPGTGEDTTHEDADNASAPVQ